MNDRLKPGKHEKPPERQAVLDQRKAEREEHPREKKKHQKIKVHSTGGVGGIKFVHHRRIPPP